MKIKMALVYADGVLQEDMKNKVGLLWTGDGEEVYMCLEILTDKQVIALLQMDAPKDGEFDLDGAMAIDGGVGGLLYRERSDGDLKWFTNCGMECVIRDVI